MDGQLEDDAPLPRVLALLWQHDSPPRRSSGLTRERIVAAAIDIADTDGLGALSMARLAERLHCGTMSLYRHVSNKDELVVFMLAGAPGAPPQPAHPTQWRSALTDWAGALWDVYHRHPWILQAASAGPPADPNQLSWLDAGLATLASTALTERDKFGAVMAVLHFVRGAAALAIEADAIPDRSYPGLLKRLIEGTRFPALSAALDAGVFDDASTVSTAAFGTGLAQLLDGVEVKMAVHS